MSVKLNRKPWSKVFDEFKKPTTHCKICFLPRMIDSFWEIFMGTTTLCQRCFSQLHVLNLQEKTPFPIWSLYRYEGVFKQWIYQYKTLRDFELRSIFLERFMFDIGLRFSHYLWIPAPSSKEDENQRGFSHLQAILDYHHLPYLPLFQKKLSFKQAHLSLEERKKVKEKIQITQDLSIQKKKVLLFDDVSSTGSTLKAMYELILPLKPLIIQGLVLAKNFG